MDCKKSKYSSEKFALLDLERIKKRPARDKMPIAVYFCKCGSWHLTSRPDWNVKIAELEKTVKNLNEERRLLIFEKAELEVKIKALETNIKKAEHKTVSSDPRIIMLNKTVRKAKDLIKKLRRSNSSLISENIQFQNKLKKL